MDSHQNRYSYLPLDTVQVYKFSAILQYGFASWSDFFKCAKDEEKKNINILSLIYILKTIYVIFFR